MSINNRNKEAMIDALLESKRKGFRLEITLRFQGKAAEADEVKAKTRKLSRKIDDLLVRAMEDWLGNAAALIKTMKNTNAKLQASIRDIKKRIKVAQNVVKAIGFLDDAIDVAVKLLI